MESYYIGGGTDWIIGHIADDVTRELKSRGFRVRCGEFADYQGEDVSFQMWWRQAQPYKNAKHNSVFITHTDDITKEKDLLRIKGQFDSFICMSEEDAQFLIELGFEKNKVFGLTLPIRNNYIRPVSIGIFSNCYPDNRKNQLWLLDYCKTHPKARNLNFLFLGTGWESVCNTLSSYNCSFEWHCASRSLPSEYFFQQLKLSRADYYLYMGMDGGAMGTYDAYAMGVELCVSDDGYHKAIPDLINKFETKEEMFVILDSICDKQQRKLEFFENHSIKHYVDKLLRVWGGDGPLLEKEVSNVSPRFFDSVKDKRRANYFPLSFRRLYQPLTSIFHRWSNKKQLESHKKKE